MTDLIKQEINSRIEHSMELKGDLSGIINGLLTEMQARGPNFAIDTLGGTALGAFAWLAISRGLLRRRIPSFTEEAIAVFVGMAAANAIGFTTIIQRSLNTMF